MRYLILMLGLLALTAGPAAHAQDFPQRPVRIIATFPQGGAADIVARVFGDKLGELWKHQAIVDNRVGGGGTVGTEAAFRAAPDGYTLLLASNTHIINQVLLPKLAFEFTRDFSALGVVASAPMMIAVHPSVPANNLREFTALLRSARGKFDYSACNMASPNHFVMEMYKHEMGLEAVHIPHRGCVPAVTDAVAGVVKAVVPNVPAALPFLNQGRLRAIALLSRDRSPALPDVPTARESGIPELKEFYLDNYYGFVAPNGVPAPILARIEADIRRVSAMPEVRQRLGNSGLDMLVLSSGEMTRLIRADAEKYLRAARQADIKPE